MTWYQKAVLVGLALVGLGLLLAVLWTRTDTFAVGVLAYAVVGLGVIVVGTGVVRGMAAVLARRFRGDGDGES